ncbi:MAG: hypothetical protein IJ661_05815 [Lachnospiraceae bacterium]|nr:hypothetical protein [Lachnospiraceae bacterium]
MHVDDRQYYNDIIEMIHKLKSDYTKKQLLEDWNYPKSLSSMMLIAGHCSTFEGDEDDIFFQAGNIILLQHHRYMFSKISRLHTYEIMQNIGMKLDKKARRDMNKIKRYLKRCGLV